MFNDIGMDTISLAGPLQAKLRAMHDAGFTQGLGDDARQHRLGHGGEEVKGTLGEAGFGQGDVGEGVEQVPGGHRQAATHQGHGHRLWQAALEKFVDDGVQAHGRSSAFRCLIIGHHGLHGNHWDLGLQPASLPIEAPRPGFTHALPVGDAPPRHLDIHDARVVQGHGEGSLHPQAPRFGYPEGSNHGLAPGVVLADVYFSNT